MNSGSVTAIDVQLRGCVGGCSVSPVYYPPGCLSNTSASFMLLLADASGKVTSVNATATPLAGMDSLRISIPTPSTPFTVFGSSYGHASYPIAHTFNAQVGTTSVAPTPLHSHMSRRSNNCPQGMPLLPWCFAVSSGLPCWAIEQLLLQGPIESVTDQASTVHEAQG